MRTIAHIQLLMSLILSGCGRDGGTTGVMDGGDGDGDSGGEIPRPLGSVVVNSGPMACELNSNCYDSTVTCPGVAVATGLNIRVGNPQGAARGTALFASGGGGGAYWARVLETAQDVILELRPAGFRTVEFGWLGRWFDGSAVDEGPAVLRDVLLNECPP